MRTVLAIVALLAGVETASAQLRIRAPFVRVDVNGGVYVRAPFVNLFIPGGPPPYAVPAPPSFVPPAPMPLDDPDQAVPPAPRTTPGSGPATPLPPRAVDPDEPPPPATAPQGLTVTDFVKSFKARAGSYEIELINPVTNRPTTVRFTLPEGTPRRVHVGRREIEFDYGARKYVKIQFDNDGAVVISR